MNWKRIIFRAVVVRRHEHGLILEAVAALILASLAVRFLPFSRTMRLAECRPPRVALSPAARAQARLRVVWAITVCAKWLPWKPVCFPQGLAAHWLLRRRHVPSVLYYGARTTADKGVEAHVWVCDEGEAIIGGEASVGMAVLARYPASDEIFTSELNIKKSKME